MKSEATMMRRVLVAVVGIIVLSPAIGLAQTAPVCSVSLDPEFGRTVEKAVPIGGGATASAARQKRYLDVLRGPQGQPLQVGTRATVRTANAIIDVYPISYEGGESFQLHLNAYRFGTPQAPQGLTCTQPLSRALGPPPVEMLIAAQELGALGIDEGRTKWFNPIPMVDNGSTRAVVFDYFRMLAARSRAESAAGRQISSVPRPSVVVVANPLSCDGTQVPATEIDVITGPQDQPLQKSGALTSGPQLSSALSGSTLQQGAVAAMFPLPFLPPGQNVRIRYGNAPASCPPELPKEYRLPIRIDESRPVTTPLPALPPGNSEADPSVFVQAVIDLDGVFQRPIYMAGPDSLREAAIAAVKTWRAIPSRMNGEPMAQFVIVRVEFTRK